MIGVYSIICAVNGKRYIGSAFRIRARWNGHRHDLRGGRHHSQKLQRAWLKYGEDAFSFEMMIVCDRKDTRFYEQRAITAYDSVKNGYNIRPDVHAPSGHHLSAEAKQRLREIVLGRKHTPEAIARMKEVHATPERMDRMRAVHLGRRNTPETIAKMRASATGREHTKATKEKLRLANLRKPITEEARQKISVALAGRTKSPETRAKMSIAAFRREAARRQAASMTTQGPA